jgi:hypothetical protein
MSAHAAGLLASLTRLAVLLSVHCFCCCLQLQEPVWRHLQWMCEAAMRKKTAAVKPSRQAAQMAAE